jgi:hypothetical protein
MGGLIEQPQLAQEPKANWRPILIGVGLVVMIVGIIAFLLRGERTASTAPHPYAANVKLSDVKMSAAENFVGAAVTYLDGTVTNTGDQTVVDATVHIVFKDSIGQVIQAENVPLHVLQAGGPYPDVVDLRVSPLSPGQSKPFRLTLEHISADWNHEYPQLQVANVSVK